MDLPMDLWIPALALLLLGSMGLRLWLASWRRRRVEAARRVEAPDSRYSSPGVRHQRDRERWGRIDLTRLHPLNQEEVRRLLDLIDANGVGALSGEERRFLDNMTASRRRT